MELNLGLINLIRLIILLVVGVLIDCEDKGLIMA
jgi:hypothetical protein